VTRPNVSDATRRFSDRVENYVRYRPRYPAGVLPFLGQTIRLSRAWTVADVGSGTGISCEPFLENGNVVYGVEPNREMRGAAERLLAGHANFRSIDGVAERTGLAASSIDLVTAMQAFHWFDPEPTAAEFSRILKPEGWVVLVWNDRRSDSPFLAEYEALLNEYGTDYRKVRHENVSEDRLRGFFGPGGFGRHVLANEQRFDYAGLEGRLMSSSYVPAAGAPGHGPLIAALQRAFERHQREGEVRFEYDTRIYFGRVR
jgi:SAM-dependent methyltransferase